MNLNINRDPLLTGNLILTMGAGNDTLNSAKLKNGDSIDMGAGDDEISIMATGSNGTPTIANLSLTLLDGGAGSDTLKFEESGTNTTELTLTTGNATNFENIIGTAGAETIKGDANANTLFGLGGADTLYGYAGNDTLYADEESGRDTVSNTLYGGAGDDTLVGAAGEDTLDGGTGTDTLTGGSGIDTFVIRSGDGGSSLNDADTVTDFTDGKDIIGMSGLNYSDLTVEQGSGDYSSHVVVKKTDSGEFLLIIQSQNISNIDDRDFSAI
jgi:Ca2+-binding RTX toxin-like protein